MSSTYKLFILPLRIDPVVKRKEEYDDEFLCANGLAKTKRLLFRLYFLYDKNFRIFEKTKSKIKYPDCNSAIKPVPHSNKYPISEPPSVLTAFDSESEAILASQLKQ